MPLRPKAGLMLWVGIAIVLSVISALVAARLTTHQHHHHHDGGEHGSNTDLHAWMHEQLQFSDEQWKALEPSEKAFEQERARLLKEIAAGGEALAAAISKRDREAPEIKVALDRINGAQRELQEKTLDHFFEMKEYLSPDQADRLIEWTHESITGQR